MIRISLQQRPEDWWTIQLPNEGEIIDVRVRYLLLTTAESAGWESDRLRMARSAQTDDAAALFDQLIDALTAEKRAAVRELLISHIVDWEFADLDSNEKLPVTKENIGGVIDYRSAYHAALFKGLLDASSPSAQKKAV